MIRINLLPPEITQKRKDEKNWRFVFAGGLALGVILFAFYMVVWLQQSIREGEVAGAGQKADMVQAQAQQYQIFETKLSDMKNRRAIADQALAQRIDWGRLFRELALVLPTDTYLTALSGAEAPDRSGTLTLGGLAPDYPKDSADTGYKVIAKVLVRLTELDQVRKVWLAGGLVRNAETAENPGNIPWNITAEIIAAPVPGSNAASAAPAPPAPQ